MIGSLVARLAQTMVRVMAAHLNIIVIEDDDFLRHATVQLLSEQGHDARGYFCAEDMDQSVRFSAAEIYVIDVN